MDQRSGGGDVSTTNNNNMIDQPKPVVVEEAKPVAITTTTTTTATAFLVPTSLEWLLDDVEVRRLYDAQYDLIEWKERVDYYQQASDDTQRTLCCLYKISLEENFDAHLKDVFSIICHKCVKPLRDFICQFPNMPSDPLIEFKKTSIYLEMDFLANVVFEICNKHLERLMKEGKDENKSSCIYLYKTKADISRYHYEVERSERNLETCKKFNEEHWNYLTGLDIKMDDPQFLGSALNHSVFYREVLGLHEKSIEFLTEITQNVSIDNSADSNKKINDIKSGILFLMKKNLKAWKATGELA